MIAIRPGQLSVAVAIPSVKLEAAAVQTPAPVFAVALAGHVITGG